MFGFYLKFSGSVIKIKKLHEYHMSEKKINWLQPNTNIKNNVQLIFPLIFIFSEHFFALNHDSLNIFWIWFANVLLRIFVSLFMSDIGLFSFISLPTFSIWVMLTSQIEFGSIIFSAIFWNGSRRIGVAAAAAAAKSLQSCPTLCDPIDSSPLGSSVPGILQARILEWVLTLL